MTRRRFPDHVPSTKINYSAGHPTSLQVRRCVLTLLTDAASPTYSFEKDGITLGALADNDVLLPDDTASRYHCRITQEGDSYLLTDLDSTNGTFVNGVRVRQAFLHPGCIIKAGKTELRFEAPEQREVMQPSQRDRLGALIGRTLRMREIFSIVEKIAPTSATVVIEGETGTGKEVVAKCIHALSARAGKPFIVFDCGAVPDNLIESELFGHEKGSFTGAFMSRRGLFETAQDGTIFLDELCELDLELQPKLLRVLEQREVRRVGSNKPVRVDVRVIAATNRNLEEEVARGRFREDLFFRLSVVRIFVPPLRERVEDIPALIAHFLAHEGFNRRLDGGRRVDEVSQEALDALLAYEWPGNVRELINILERACSFAESSVIGLGDLPEPLRRRGTTGPGTRVLPALRLEAPPATSLLTPPPATSSGAGSAEGSPPADGPTPVPAAAAEQPPLQELPKTFKDAKEEWVSAFEREYLLHLLRKNGNNISHAARDADIDRKYFRKLMRKYSLGTNDPEDQPTED